MELNPAVDDGNRVDVDVDVDVDEEDDGDWQEWTAEDDENVTSGDVAQCLFCTEKVRNTCDPILVCINIS